MSPHRRLSRAVAALGAAAALAACDRDDARAASRDGAALGRRVPYRVVAVDSAGRVEGTVSLRAAPPADTTVALPPEARACGGDSLRLPLVDHSGPLLGDAVVWLDDIRGGKPLPLARRYAITSEQCQLAPRVQAALVGGMLNVRSADPMLHRTRFALAGSRAALATVEHNDAGQVIPVESVLRQPSRVEVASELYPWMRAWIQVFDHPYFAVTPRDGTYSLDAVPPGRYHLIAWHPRFGTRDTVVTLAAGDTARVEITLPEPCSPNRRRGRERGPRAGEQPFLGPRSSLVTVTSPPVARLHTYHIRKRLAPSRAVPPHS